LPDDTSAADPVAAYLSAVQDRYEGSAAHKDLHRWASDFEERGGGSEYDWMARSLIDVPPLLAAVGAALAEHKAVRIYEPCDHDHTDEDVAAGRTVDAFDFISCEELYLYTICRGCCGFAGTMNGQQTEECAAEHDHGRCYPCPTRVAITTALLGEVPDGDRS